MFLSSAAYIQSNIIELKSVPLKKKNVFFSYLSVLNLIFSCTKNVFIYERDCSTASMLALFESDMTFFYRRYVLGFPFGCLSNTLSKTSNCYFPFNVIFTPWNSVLCPLLWVNQLKMQTVHCPVKQKHLTWKIRYRVSSSLEYMHLRSMPISVRKKRLDKG